MLMQWVLLRLHFANNKYVVFHLCKGEFLHCAVVFVTFTEVKHMKTSFNTE